MNDKRKLRLSALEGNDECFLEIEVLQNGDMYVGMRGQDIEGVPYCVSAQIPNPINGGGNMDDYKTLVKIYDVLKPNSDTASSSKEILKQMRKKIRGQKTKK